MNRSTERRSASMSNIDINNFDDNLEKELKKLSNKLPPSNTVSSSDIFIRDLNDQWKIYQNNSGRIFYHNHKLSRSSWKPPRSTKPRLESDETDSLVSMVRDSIRDENDNSVSTPPGYVEYFDKITGFIK